MRVLFSTTKNDTDATTNITTDAATGMGDGGRRLLCVRCMGCPDLRRAYGLYVCLCVYVCARERKR